MSTRTNNHFSFYNCFVFYASITFSTNFYFVSTICSTFAFYSFMIFCFETLSIFILEHSISPLLFLNFLFFRDEYLTIFVVGFRINLLSSFHSLKFLGSNQIIMKQKLDSRDTKYTIKDLLAFMFDFIANAKLTLKGHHTFTIIIVVTNTSVY